MASFQKITIIVAIIILIVSLALIGVLMYNSKSENVYPPIEPGCPAYWMMQSTNNKLRCVPPAGDPIPGYSSEEGCRDPIYPDFSSKISRCAAFQIAEKCNLSWDGVTNVGNPCDGLEI